MGDGGGGNSGPSKIGGISGQGGGRILPCSSRGIGELILSTPSHRQKSACGVRRTGSAPITALGLSLRHEVCRTRRRARTARQERYKRRN